MKTKTKSKSTTNPFLKMKNTILTRVLRGVKFLDKEFGRKGWVSRINLGHLELDSPSLCVLGQTFPGNFEEGIARLEEVKGAGSLDYMYGFNGPGYEDDNKLQQYFDILNSVWVEKIKKYRAALENPKIKSLQKVLDSAVKKAEAVI